MRIMRFLRTHPPARLARLWKKSFARGKKPAGELLTAMLLVPFHRVPPPKESMKKLVENRRLLMSILVLAKSAIVLE